jgi:hypothetical protein
MNDSSHRYTLGTSAQHAQFACTTRDEAITRAFAFARRYHVDVWQTEDDMTFERIAEPPAATTSPKRSQGQVALRR